MPRAKPKPKPVLARARAVVRSHPRGIRITLASAGAFVALLAAAWPFLPRFQTVEAAERNEKDHAKVHAETLYGQARIETFVLRQQVNDCVLRSNSVKGKAERDLCDGYRREYEQADRRMQTLQDNVLKPQK